MPNQDGNLVPDILRSMEIRTLSALLWDVAMRSNADDKKKDWLGRTKAFRDCVISGMGSHGREYVAGDIARDEFDITLKAIEYAYTHRDEDDFWRQAEVPFTVSASVASVVLVPLPCSPNKISSLRESCCASRAIHKIAAQQTVLQLFGEKALGTGDKTESLRKQRRVPNVTVTATLAQKILASLAMDFIAAKSDVKLLARIVDALFASGYGMLKTYYLYQTAETATLRGRACRVRPDVVDQLIMSLPSIPDALTTDLGDLVAALAPNSDH